MSANTQWNETKRERFYFVTAAAFLSAGEAVWMTIVVLLKRNEVIGLRIALAMIFAGSAPFIALAAGKMV